MSETIKPYQDSEKGKKEQVAQMFDTISENYDGLNKIISFGTDAKWKQKILKMVAAKQVAFMGGRKRFKELKEFSTIRRSKYYYD